MRRQLNKYYRKFRRELGWRNDRHLYFLTPQNNWVLDWVGHYVTSNVQEQFGLPSHLVTNSSGLIDQIVHYGSLWDLASILKHRDFDKKLSKNFLVGTVFHGERHLPIFDEALDLLIEKQDYLEAVIVSTGIMHQRLLKWGILAEKMVKIPLGVDTQKFVIPEINQREVFRDKLGVPEDAVCVGSFQKDGVGLEEGLEPKLIKGPDVFLDVIEKLGQDYPIFVLLTGPARGYVKQGLDKLGVPYRHDVLDNYLDIVNYFQASDLYLVTAREEGGPQALLEAPACGVPLVTTKVGMAPDIHKHEVTALMTEIEDVGALVEQAGQVIEDKELRTRLVKNGLEVARAHDWQMIAARYYHEVYAPILEK